MQIDQIGKGISSRRKQKGLSQKELASMLGVTRQAVSRWESGTALPSVDNMIELSKALAVSVDELLQLKEPSSSASLSPQSVGVLLDEYSARQEKRIKRLTIALAAAAAILVLGIVTSTVIALVHTKQMETQLNDRITATNVQLSSTIDGLNARISSTIQQAVSDGNTRLTDSGYHVDYDHAARAFVVHLYACPKTLGAYHDASFSFILKEGERLTGTAELINGRFKGSMIIPDQGQHCISGDAYVTWQENDETITGAIKFYDIWTYFDRLMITSAWMDTQQRQGSSISVKPWAMVFLSFDAPDTYPVSICYDIYSGKELIATYTEDWPVQKLRTSADFNATTITHTSSEYIKLDGVASADDVMLRVTVTDALGREFIYSSTPNQH